MPEPISAGAVGDIVAKHAAAAGVREDRRTAHALRHTFCTMLAERGVAMEVIRALAGHIDIRTTQIYVDVTDERKTNGIAALERVAPVGQSPLMTEPETRSRGCETSTRCTYCRAVKPRSAFDSEGDHVVPASLGGAWVDEMVCHECNERAKHSRRRTNKQGLPCPLSSGAVRGTRSIWETTRAAGLRTAAWWRRDQGNAPRARTQLRGASRSVPVFRPRDR